MILQLLNRRKNCDKIQKKLNLVILQTHEMGRGVSCQFFRAAADNYGCALIINDGMKQKDRTISETKLISALENVYSGFFRQTTKLIILSIKLLTNT